MLYMIINKFIAHEGRTKLSTLNIWQALYDCYYEKINLGGNKDSFLCLSFWLIKAVKALKIAHEETVRSCCHLQ